VGDESQKEKIFLRLIKNQMFQPPLPSLPHPTKAIDLNKLNEVKMKKEKEESILPP
jgi:hypothetical protein